MQGLKMQQNEEFLRFFKIVQEEAEKKESIFFLSTGEGHLEKIGEIEAEDLSGWLIPKEKAKVFSDKWEKDRSFENLDEWGDYFLWVIWEIENGEIKINFKHF